MVKLEKFIEKKSFFIVLLWEIFVIINIYNYLGGMSMELHLLVTQNVYDWLKESVCGGNDVAAKIVSIVLIILLIALFLWFIIALIKGKKKKVKKETSVAVDDEPVMDVSPSKSLTEESKGEETEMKKTVKEEKVAKSKSTEKKTTEAPKRAEPVASEEVMTETMILRTKGKYEVFPVNDVFMYRLKASNGEILVTSEIYKSAKGAVAAVETIKKSIESGTIAISKDKHNMYQFKLFAQNKRLLAVSANYPTETRCQSAAESFKKFALISPIVNLEEDPDHLMEKIEITEKDDKNGGKVVVELDGTYSFKLLANNGVIICSSEEYKTKVGVMNAIDSLKEAIKTGTFYVIKDKRDMYQFKLYAVSGRAVVYGETYKNKAQAISAANSVFSFMNKAEIIDKTIQEEVK